MKDKQTKNIVTRKQLEEDLLFTATADVRYLTVVSATFSLLMLFFGLGLSLMILLPCDSAFEWGALVFSCLLVGGAPCALWINVLHRIQQRRRIQNGEFEVTAAPLLYKAERAVVTRRRMTLIEELHFEGFDPFQPTHTVYQLADASDVFYLVHMKGSKCIMRAYFGEMYEYK